MKEIMFSVPLFQYEIESWDIKKNKLKQIYKRCKIEQKEHVKTDYFESERKTYNNEIEGILKDELNQFRIETNLLDYSVRSSWFELSTKHDYHPVHIHGNIGYSSICFIDFDPAVHSATHFIGPFFNFIKESTLEYVPNVVEGTIIFFPSSIKHFTIPHNSDKERLIVSFNLR